MTKFTIIVLLCLFLGGCKNKETTVYSFTPQPTMCQKGDGPWFPSRADGVCYAEDAPK